MGSTASRLQSHYEEAVYLLTTKFPEIPGTHISSHPNLSFDQSNNTGAIDVKMDESVLEEKSSFKSSLLNWIGALTLSLLLKLPSKKWTLG